MEHEPNYQNSHVRSRLIFPIFRYAIIMFIASLVAGIFSREFGRSFQHGVPLAAQWLAGHYLNQLHGHVLAIGFVLPLGLGLMTYVLRASLIVSDVNILRILFAVMVVGSLATLLLLLYKGIATVILVGADPSLSLDQVDQQLFNANGTLRIALHTVSHTALGVSTICYMLKLRQILGFVGPGHR
jgi:heme/copper-type cytochrome/quinol oxidase subunit 1